MFVMVKCQTYSCHPMCILLLTHHFCSTGPVIVAKSEIHIGDIQCMQRVKYILLDPTVLSTL